MDSMADAGGIPITKHGKSVAKIIPIELCCAHLIGALKGRMRINGDILSTGLEWYTAKRNVHGAQFRGKTPSLRI